MEGNSSIKEPEKYQQGLDSTQLVFAGIALIFTIMGIAGNIALIHIYKAKNLNVRFNCLMMFLSICDLCFLVMGILDFVTIEIVGETPFLGWLVQVCFTASVYTTVAIAMERYLVFCRNVDTEEIPTKWVLWAITFVSISVMAPYYLWYSTNYPYFAFTLSFQFVFQAFIPECIMIKCNLSLYKQLKIIQSSKNLTKTTIQCIRKSVFRAKLTLSITGIFIIGSMIMWLPTLPYELIHWKPEEFQELKSDAMIFVILGNYVYVINCSANYFVYKYLEWLEKKVKEPKSQFHTELSKDMNPTNLSSSA